ncbi:MAG: DUF89 family protein [Firmicutes bacterium]|nr:DUF89 family protein [Bacillota bacterium]
MKVKPECIPCTFRQVLNVAKVATDKPETQLAVLYAAAKQIPNTDISGAPAELLPLFLQDVYKVLGVRDPYAEKKRQINAQVQELLPQLEREVAESEDPLFTAFLLAVAGNVIDLGILPEYDLVSTINEVFELQFAVNDYPKLREAVEKAKKIVYLGDNAGEIVLDKLAVRELARKAPVTYVVKGGVILNDATLEDARQVKMTELATVIDNGSAYPGTVLRDISDEAKEELRSADLIISKGQANYETLDELPAPIFFILRAKCDYVAQNLGVELGDVVLKASDHYSPRAKI